MSKDVKSLQCVEFNNLYIDNEANIQKTNDILTICEYMHDTFAYAYILHDHDVYDDDTFDSNFKLLGHKGELKKPHYHCYIKYYSSTPIERFESLFNVQSKDYHIFKPKDFDNKLVYLTHVKHQDKYQYSIEDVHSNIYDYCYKIYLNARDNLSIDFVPFVLDVINCYAPDTPINLSELLPLCISKGYKASEIKSNMFMINCLVNEHNRYATSIQSSIYEMSLKEMRDHKYLSKNIEEMIKNFGFGDIEIDNKVYTICQKTN